MAWTFREKTNFTGFIAADEQQILDTMQTAYDRSPTAKTMFDTWINGGNIINIQFQPGQFKALTTRSGPPTGLLQIDLTALSNASYITY
jgi:hypothetical protein